MNLIEMVVIKVEKPWLQWNGTTMMVEDIQVDFSWSLLMGSLMWMIILLEAIIGWKLSGIIVSYLKNKPPGEHQITDHFHRIAFQSVKNHSWVATIYFFFLYTFADTGDTIAKIWMWPIYMTTAIAIITFNLNPLAQLVLAGIPSDRFSLGDKWIYMIINSIFWIPMMIVMIVCSCLGYYPPGYFLMRHQTVKYTAFQFPTVTSNIIFLLSLLFGLFFKGKGKNAIMMPKKHPLKLTSFVIGCVIIIVYTIFDLKKYLSVIVCLIVYVIVPSVVLLINDKLTEYTERKHPKVWKNLAKFKKLMFKDLKVHPTNQVPGSEAIEMQPNPRLPSKTEQTTTNPPKQRAMKQDQTSIVNDCHPRAPPPLSPEVPPPSPVSLSSVSSSPTRVVHNLEPFVIVQHFK